jgi:hypothetical protein
MTAAHMDWSARCVPVVRLNPFSHARRPFSNLEPKAKTLSPSLSLPPHPPPPKSKELFPSPDPGHGGDVILLCVRSINFFFTSVLNHLFYVCFRRGVRERKQGIRAKQQRNLKLQMEFYDEEKDAADWSAYQFIFAPSPVVVTPPDTPHVASAPPAAADGVPAPYPPACTDLPLDCLLDLFSLGKLQKCS